MVVLYSYLFKSYSFQIHILYVITMIICHYFKLYHFFFIMTELNVHFLPILKFIASRLHLISIQTTLILFTIRWDSLFLNYHLIACLIIYFELTDILNDVFILILLFFPLNHVFTFAIESIYYMIHDSQKLCADIDIANFILIRQF